MIRFNEIYSMLSEVSIFSLLSQVFQNSSFKIQHLKFIILPLRYDSLNRSIRRSGIEKNG